jgi:redox-sensitive bicupin YhaK (pirin superfamily)
MIPPKIQLLSEREDSMPTVVEYAPQDKTITSSTLVIAGSFKDHHSTMTLYSELTILHVRLFRIPVQDESWKQVSTPSWTFHLPDHYSTAIIYVRSGSVDIAGTRIPPHHTAHLTSKGEALVVSLTNSTSHSWSFPPLSWNNATNQQQMGADFILLAGEPLNEPVVAQGSMVMNSYPEINRAYQDYQRGLFGLPWKETLSDADWQIHVKTYGIGSGNEI